MKGKSSLHGKSVTREMHLLLLGIIKSLGFGHRLGWSWYKLKPSSAKALGLGIQFIHPLDTVIPESSGSSLTDVTGCPSHPSEGPSSNCPSNVSDSQTHLMFGISLGISLKSMAFLLKN